MVPHISRCLTRVCDVAMVIQYMYNKHYVEGIIGRQWTNLYIGGEQLSNTKVQVLLFADDIVANVH